MSAPKPETSGRFAGLGWAALAALAGLALAAIPAGGGADWLWGSALGETDNHLWMYWWASARMADPDVLFVNAPTGLHLPLMDPVNLPVFAALRPLGVLVAWQGVLLWNVLLAALGGGALGAVVAGRRGALAAGLFLATAAPFWGVIDFGITESWPIGWLALHLALLVDYSRRGGIGRALGAGLTLGLVALSGWYLAVQALLIEVLVVGALLWRRRRLGLVLQGLVALAMVLPRFLQFLGERETWAHRWMPPAPGPPGPRPDWDVLPVAGTDLLNLVMPHFAAVRPSKASYLGLVALLLVGLGLWRDRRRALPWALGALPLLILALGYWPTVAGKAIGLPGPAFFLVKLAPALLGLSHWERAVIAVLPLLAALVALGARQLPVRLLPLGLLTMAADATLLSPTPWPREGFVAQLPEGLATLPDGGGVVLLPFDNGREPFSAEPARLYNRYQALLGRPVSENYEGIDALLVASPLVGALDAICAVPTTLPPYYQPPPEARSPVMPEGAALEAAVRELRGWGFSTIYLTRSRCRVAPTAIQRLNALFGPGEVFPDGNWRWTLPAR